METYIITLYMPDALECAWLRILHAELFTDMAVNHPDLAIGYEQQPGSHPVEPPHYCMTVAGLGAGRAARLAFDALIARVETHLQRTKFGLPWTIDRVEWDADHIDFSEELQWGFEISIHTGMSGASWSLRDYWIEHAPPDWDVIAEAYRQAHPNDAAFEHMMEQ